LFVTEGHECFITFSSHPRRMFTSNHVGCQGW